MQTRSFFTTCLPVFCESQIEEPSSDWGNHLTLCCVVLVGAHFHQRWSKEGGGLSSKGLSFALARQAFVVSESVRVNS